MELMGLIEHMDLMEHFELIKLNQNPKQKFSEKNGVVILNKIKNMNQLNQKVNFLVPHSHVTNFYQSSLSFYFQQNNFLRYFFILFTFLYLNISEAAIFNPKKLLLWLVGPGLRTFETNQLTLLLYRVCENTDIISFSANIS